MDIKIDDRYIYFEKHIRYTLDVLLSDVLDIDGEMPLIIFYGHEISVSESSSKQIIQIIPGNFFSKDIYLSSESLPQLPISWLDVSKFAALRMSVFGPRIPVLYWGQYKREDVVFKENSLIICTADIIASTFFMLTRYEEIIVTERDESDRFPASSSLAYKEGFFHRPIVNEYAELVWDWIITLVPDARRKRKVYQLKLTHDVDQVRKYGAISRELRTSGSLAIKHLEPWKAITHLTGMVMTKWGGRKDPYNCYEELMDISEQNGCKACFYFMAGEPGSPDTRYNVNEEGIITIIRRILERDHQIGLHPGLGTYQSLERLQLQKENFDRVLGYKDYGARQHYLQWRAPDTWRLYERVGLTHDSSVGYVETPGFRCGICVPFKVFDAVEGKNLNLKEIPLIAMDASLLSPKYGSIQYNNNKNHLLNSIKQNIKKVSGTFCLLWHNISNDKYGIDVLRYLM